MNIFDKNKALFAENNGRVDCDSLITAYASSVDGYEYLKSLTRKELLALKNTCYNDAGVESQYINNDTPDSSVVYIVNKALTKALS